MRLIPGRTKVQVEIFKGITMWDLILALFELGILALIIISNLPIKWLFIAVHIIISVVSLYKIDGISNYMYLIYLLKHYAYKRNYDRHYSDELLIKKATDSDVVFNDIFPEYEEEQGEVQLDSDSAHVNDKKWEDIGELTAFENIEDNLIKFKGDYYGAAFEIPDVEFRFFNEFRRNNAVVNGLGAVIRAQKNAYGANILKIERPVDYEQYEYDVAYRIENIKQSFAKGFIDEDELKGRLAILYKRLEQIQSLRNRTKIVIPYYYLIIFDSDKNQLEMKVPSVITTLTTGEIPTKRLNSKELAVMLKYSSTLDFNEQDINKLRPEDYAAWAMPQSVVINQKNAVVDGIVSYTMMVKDYPVLVPDGWLASTASYPSTKMLMKFRPVDNATAIRTIDKSIQELRTVVTYAKKDSDVIGASTHLQSLQATLAQLKNNNEILFMTNIYVTAYDIVETQNNDETRIPNCNSYRYKINGMKDVIKNLWHENGMPLSTLEFRQVQGYIGAQVSGYDPFEDTGRAIPSVTLAGSFPWVFPHTMDEKGTYMGTSMGVPVFLNLFTRNKERVNSNVVIIGKSGSGKSYATKAILANLAADDAKIFILDPEDEYRALATNLHGKFINVASNENGIINPFHIIANLDDEEGDGSGSSYSNHLQFLEEYFKVVLPDCDKDALEYLNTLVEKVYKRKNIHPNTDISTLKATDYPTFDDLYYELLLEYRSTPNDYLKGILRTLLNYISKFCQDGRYANIWNGYSTLETDENFTVFNFQSLLANRNTVVSNAQMLLVLKYLDNEIIKNRAYNEKYGLDRKIVVVIDEAHVFIDNKYPVALDFMYQLAKRIRKYNGMQIVITQNVKDFVGSEEIARKSSAIINACQYSFIFSLAANDMDDLCTLYDKAGKINETEQNRIVQAPRGEAFVILDPNARTSFTITVPDYTRQMFEEECSNPYFDGEGGFQNWEHEAGPYIAEHEASVKSLEENTEELGDLNNSEVKAKIEELLTTTDTDAASFSSKYSPLSPELHEEPAPQPAAPASAIPVAGQAPTVVFQPANQPVVTTVTDDKTTTLLEGLLDKLGEISEALAASAARPIVPQTADMSLLANEISKLTQSISNAPVISTAVTTSAAVATSAAADEDDFFASSDFDFESKPAAPEQPEETEEIIETPIDEISDEESTAILANIFDTVVKPEKDPMDMSGDELFADDKGEDEETNKEDFFANFDVMQFLSDAADKMEDEAEEGFVNEDFEKFMDGSEISTFINISIEDLINYNKKH